MRYFTIKYDGPEQALSRWVMSEMGALHEASGGKLIIHGHTDSGRDPSLPEDAHHEELKKAANAACAGHEECRAGASLEEHIEVLLAEIAELRKGIAMHSGYAQAAQEAIKALESGSMHVGRGAAKKALEKAVDRHHAHGLRDAREWRRNGAASAEARKPADS